jgi:transcriptional regulator with XRE-family HTH domain
MVDKDQKRDDLTRNPVARVLAYELARIGLERQIGAIEMAERAGVSIRILLAILDCRHNFTLSTVTRLAEALDVPVERLFRMTTASAPSKSELLNIPRESRLGSKFVRTIKRLRDDSLADVDDKSPKGKDAGLPPDGEDDT